MSQATIESLASNIKVVLAVTSDPADKGWIEQRCYETDIHSVRNDGEADSMSLHIYGRDLATTGRSEYDPINKVERPCPVRKR